MGYPAIGHNDPRGGGSRNAFGAAYSKKSPWNIRYCCADSDGDGQTNGHELGDSCCVWTKYKIPDNTTDISHPGLKSSTTSRPVPACVATVCNKSLRG